MDNNKKEFSRRKFLARTGLGLVGSMALLYFGRSPLRRGLSGLLTKIDLPSGITDFDTSLWFEINDDNTITLKSAKIEMGQGIFTGFAMLAAEELDVPLYAIKVVHATTDNGPIDSLGTGGSTSTTSLYEDIREVAATLRETLKLAAGKHWAISSPAKIQTKNGVLSFEDKQITYAELAKQTKQWEAADTPILRPESSFKYVGTEQKRIDGAGKVLGQTVYGMDVHLPLMAFGAVLYCPYIGGKLKTADISEAKKSSGVLAVIEDAEWIGVAANSHHEALLAVQKIKATWDFTEKYTQETLLSTITVGKGTEVNLQKTGTGANDLDEKSPLFLQAAYRTPLGIHATIEPSISVADVKGDTVDVYMSYQTVMSAKADIAKKTNFSSDNIHIKPQFVGGGFGRKYAKHNAVEAIKLSEAIHRPVHLAWTRQQECQNGYCRPNTHHVLKGQVDNTGKIIHLSSELSSADMVLLNTSSLALDILGADMISAGHGLRIPYQIENKSATLWQARLPFKTGIWRSVGMFANTFAMESFMDELAHKAKKDPLTFRLEHLDESDDLQKRRRDVLKIAAEKAHWTQPKPVGIGRGIASGEDRKSICAAVVEVKMVDGIIKISKVIQVLDAGKVINPNGVRQQVEGATLMAMSAAMFEALHIEDGQFMEKNFDSYRIGRMSDAPEIDVYIHEGSSKPYGVGEPPMAPIAPAIANAIFDLTGKRPREIPFV